MAYYDSTSNKTIFFPDRPYPNYKKWVKVDCGCCNGIEWGGEYPRECKICGGTGFYARHIKSGALAHYPGGPFIGKETPDAD